MANIIQGDFTGKGKKIGIIISRFNEFITQKLLDGALDCLQRHGTNTDDIDIYWVPGSFEIPLIAAKMAKSKKYDAVICLGTIIRGATPHFDYIANEVAKGIAQINMDTDIPAIFGIITADNIEQAIERAGTKAGNKGGEAALSTIEMINVLREIS